MPVSHAPTAVTPTAAGAQASTFDVPGMDCPAEERLIRLALQDLPGVQALRFDLPARQLQVRHQGPADAISAALQPLGFGARWRSTAAAADPDPGLPAAPEPAAADESRVLRWLLGLNAAMFVVELVAGWWAQSTGLIADSLDMFADAAVYGVALLAVGQAASRQRRAARLSGWLQLALAAGALIEVLRRAVTGSAPEAPAMVGIATLALAVNLACVALLARHREGGVHMKASWIFSTNDALANLGVMLAGALVAWTGSPLPDLLIGLAIALLVANGARRILRLPG
ncbi:MAG TPA: cation transporter [Burkholderiaceae bacterium]|nr:cation transporter [Burkholderiaceae bacterium]